MNSEPSPPDPMTNDIKEIPSQPAPIPSQTSTNLVTSAPKKKLSALPVTIAFLAGALIYAVFSGAYNLYLQQLQHDNASGEKSVVETPATQQSNVATVEEAAIQQEDLDEYVEATDCTTRTEYVSYKQMFSKGKIKTIDLYDGAQIGVIDASFSRTYIATWSERPPIALDYKCDTISLTKIIPEDRVNVYADINERIQEYSRIENVRIIQKASK